MKASPVFDLNHWLKLNFGEGSIIMYSIYAEALLARPATAHSPN